jgi:hypothetical protein
MVGAARTAIQLLRGFRLLSDFIHGVLGCS